LYFNERGHSQKKTGSRDPGSHDFFGQNSEKYFVGKFFQKLRKNTKKYFEKFGKIV